MAAHARGRQDGHEELAFLSALDQARMVRAHEVSPSELVTAYLERIAALDGALGSYVTVAGEQALRDASRAEQQLRRSSDLPPFHGVPIAIKDLNATTGLRTTFSSKHYADFVPDDDHVVVAKLREAGFITLGKTNTPELGSFAVTESELNGVCRNPWDTARTSGGSSGGAAVAVAAGLAPASQGNDGGGSIRIPAACCGIFGIKPTRGRVSQAPLFGDILFGLSSDGPMTRTVADAAAMLDAMAGYVTGDPYWAPPPARPFLDEVGADPGRLRIAVTTTGAWETDVDPECRTAVDEAAELLTELGHEVVEAAPDWNGPGVFEPFKTVFQALVGYHPIDDFSVLEPANRALAESARATDSIEMVKAVVAFQAYSRRVVAFWNDFDLLLTPVTAQPPLPHGAIFEDDPWQVDSVMMRFIPYTPVANMTGQPAISVPLHWSPEGLPIGVQLMGRPADEATLFRVAAQLEEARPWAHQRPSLAAAPTARG